MQLGLWSTTLAAGAATVVACVGDDPGDVQLDTADAGADSTGTSGADGSAGGDDGSTGGGDTDGAADSGADANPCVGALHAFVSSKQFNGNFGGRAGGDMRCATLAAAAGLGDAGVWKAWLSSNQINAIDLLPDDGRWCLVDDTTYVGTHADLTVGPKHAVNEFETGAQAKEASGPAAVWTGTLANGTKSTNNCNNWNSGALAMVGGRGNYTTTDNTWTHWPTAGAVSAVSCNNDNRIYCFQVR